MIQRRLEIGLWCGALAASLLAGVRARTVGKMSFGSELHSLMAAPRPTAPERSDLLVASAETLVTRDPFRLDRRPSATAYSPGLETGPPPPPRPPRPPLAVTGIVGGPPWEALVEGIPGRAGSVLVRRGDTLSGLRVRSISKDTVRITGMDTTWKLPVRKAWQ